MPSQSLLRWQSARAAALGGLDAEASAALARLPPDPVLVDTLVRGYVVLLAAHFQAFARDLYSECVTAMLAGVVPSLQLVVQLQCNTRCELDGSNARFESLRADFGRFDLNLLNALKARDPRAEAAVTALNHLNQWRNFVAHGNVVPPAHGGPLALAAVRGWRATGDSLATSLDAVLYDHLKVHTGVPPW
jgi:hypothetical protein